MASAPVARSTRAQRAPRPAAAASSTVERRRLGAVRLGRDGRSQLVSFEVPPDAASVVLTARAKAGAAINFTDLRAPSGADLVDETLGGAPDRWLGPSHSANRVSPSALPSFASLTIPAAEAVRLTPGTWRVAVSAEVAAGGRLPSSVELELAIKRGPPRPTRGTVQLALHFTGANGWTAKTAAARPDFQRVLGVMKAQLASAGIELAVASMSDAPGKRRTFSLDEGSLGKLFESTRGDGAVHLFFVDKLTLPDEPEGGRGFSGVSGAVPGPARAGTCASGIALAVGSPRDPEATGLSASHELGHYLGLPHTDDEMGPDQFSDTPNGPSGQANLMYPQHGNRLAKLSAQQKRLMLLHPLVANPAATPGRQK